MKIGFGSQVWLNDNHFENFPRMLDELSLVGMDGFEMCFPFLIDQYEHRTGELRRLLAMHDLELANYYTGIAFHGAVSAPNLAPNTPCWTEARSKRGSRQASWTTRSRW